MKPQRLTFFVVLLAVILMLGACSEKTDSTSSSKTGEIRQTASTSGKRATPGHVTVIAKERSIEADPAADVDQVFRDLSEAKVQGNTHDLKQTFGKLDDICAIAVSTCDALLSADYLTEQHRELLARKEALR